MTKKPNPKPSAEDRKEVEDETLQDDQHRRSYYYDDAHGYEKYVGDEEGGSIENVEGSEL